MRISESYSLSLQDQMVHKERAKKILAMFLRIKNLKKSSSKMK